MKKQLFLMTLMMGLLAAGLSAQDAKVYNNGSIDFVPPGTTFDLSAVDNQIGIAKIHYRINDGAEQIYSAPLAFKDEGRFTIYYWSEDLLGNLSAPHTKTFQVDATAPTVKLTTRGTAFTKDGVTYLKSTTGLLLVATDLGAGVDSVWFSLDKANYIKFNDEAFVNEEGAKSLWAYAIDRVGNKSAPVEFKLVVDNTPPKVGIVPVTPLQAVRGERYTNPGNSFVVRADDEVAGIKTVEVSVNHQEFFSYADPLVLTEPGSYSIRARAVDNLGNVSALVELNFIVDGAHLVTTLGNPVVPATVAAAPVAAVTPAATAPAPAADATAAAPAPAAAATPAPAADATAVAPAATPAPAAAPAPAADATAAPAAAPAPAATN